MEKSGDFAVFHVLGDQEAMTMVRASITDLTLSDSKPPTTQRPGSDEVELASGCPFGQLTLGCH